MSITFWSGIASDEGVNFANSNAFMILNRLGIDAEYGGKHDATDFLGRVLVANVGHDDSGTADTIDRGPNGATMIDCGHREGYWASAMERLADMATAAARTTGKVYWG